MVQQEEYFKRRWRLIFRLDFGFPLNKPQNVVSKTSEWFNLTFATWRGFWCSTPPWRRKPHGAPPDNVIITSSATIFLPFLSFPSFSCLFSVLPFSIIYLFFKFHLGASQCSGPMVSAPWSSDVLFACHTVRVLSWSPASRPILTPEHTCECTHSSVHPPTPGSGQPS